MVNVCPLAVWCFLLYVIEFGGPRCGLPPHTMAVPAMARIPARLPFSLQTDGKTAVQITRTTIKRTAQDLGQARVLPLLCALALSLARYDSPPHS